MKWRTYLSVKVSPLKLSETKEQHFSFQSAKKQYFAHKNKSLEKDAKNITPEILWQFHIATGIYKHLLSIFILISSQTG